MSDELIPRSVSFNGYKCFTEENTIPWFSKINVIIGRNNSGKTSFINIIHALCSTEFHNSETPNLNLKLTFLLDRYAFKYGYNNGFITQYSINPDDNNFIRYFDSYFAGKEVKLHLISNKQPPTYSYSLDQTFCPHKNKRSYEIDVQSNINYNPLDGSIFRSISSERDIIPEQLVNYKEKLNIDSKGSGTTRYVCSIINDKAKNDSIIQVNILKALNHILGEDGNYRNIKVKRDDNDTWEIYLENKEGRQYQLSKLGSGLKTILLVLLNLIAIPEETSGDKQIVFAFEELENNLHPALAKRLYSYIFDYAQSHNYPIFLTTHSPVTIDLFSREKSVRFYKTEQTPNGSRIIPISNFDETIEIIDELGLKASDLLQANGIIWVEGPSDRIYVKHWLDKLHPQKFEEGKHYQFAYYGGRLLSHYTACDPSDEEVENYINILAINTNAFLIMDKDGKNTQTQLAKRKKHIITKLDEKGIHYWITAGREIENYLDLSPIGIHLERFEKLEEKLRKKFDKIEFAKKHCDMVDFSYLKLNKSIEDLASEISRWNEMK